MDLRDDERLALLGMRALHTTGDGDEVFVGLDATESSEFLPLNRQYECGDGWSKDEQGRFLKLRAKHEVARQAVIQGLATAS